VADVVDEPEVAAEGRESIGDREVGERREPPRARPRIEVTFGLKPSGAVWIEGLIPSSARSASTSATSIVYVVRSSVLQSGS
jgi:hypothetical protein